MVTQSRSWRKLHVKVIDSERAPRLSDSAFTLFFLLVAAQDDEGYYPWTPQAVRRLTISRTWSLEEAKEFANELVAEGMAWWDEGATGIVLDRGEELNGRPRLTRAALTYRNRPVVPHETPQEALGTEVDQRLPLADQRLPIDKTRQDLEEETDRESEADPEESVTDWPISLQREILGQYSPQELVDLRGSYPLLDLESEAEKCFAWYNGKGETIRDVRAVYGKWLERARAPNKLIPLSKAKHSSPPRAAPSWEKPHLTPSLEAEALWEKCKALLEGRVPRPIYATRISPTRGFAVDGDVFWVQAETAAAADTLDRRMVGLCEKALSDVGKPNAELKLFVEPT